MGIYGFLAAFVIAFTMGAIAVAIFRRPLDLMLSEACETEAISHFWRIYLSTLFVLVPVVGSSGYAVLARQYELQPVTLIEGAFLVSASGLLFALMIVGTRISNTVGRLIADPDPKSSAG